MNGNTAQALAVSQTAPPAPMSYAMAVEELTGQVSLIQNVMKRVMKDKEHYGTIPGCGNKPTLLKPGAEKLAMTFRFAPKYEIQERELRDGHREYRVIASLQSIITGAFVGDGVGVGTTMESKYRFRKAEQTCPQCGQATIIKGKQEYGGGWLCYKNKGGCGAKFKAGDPEIENQEMGRIEHDNPADYYNTVLKMAKKRALVDAVLTATAASDIFTQDIEDMAGNGEAQKQPSPAQQPQQQAKPQSQQGTQNQASEAQVRMIRQTAQKAGFDESGMLQAIKMFLNVDDLTELDGLWSSEASKVIGALKDGTLAPVPATEQMDQVPY
ncbi:MAG: hypothetical protein FD177_255 [Desulfovibrionaceae bacterium]|nr:MAG: hypothetical protein FD177_255 [Desulfovibrionaceae bacterium]